MKIYGLDPTGDGVKAVIRILYFHQPAVEQFHLGNRNFAGYGILGEAGPVGDAQGLSDGCRRLVRVERDLNFKAVAETFESAGQHAALLMEVGCDLDPLIADG